MKTRPARVVALCAAGALLASACGGDESTSGTSAGEASATEATDESEGTADETTSTDATDGTTSRDTGPVIDSIDEVRPAVVQVRVQGSFRDPAEGQQTSEGSGSGFIIDPEGIVVTNNHVVTGAGIVNVALDDDREVAARVLGVSECNDLAVLELTEPGPYPSLEWYDGAIEPALEVYTAGFPLGDPEYTLTRGIVSKAEADGETAWASVQHVIEHDAAIQPGNSGGPLVSADGRVVGVNYSTADYGTGTNQFFAIAADLARPVVEELQSGDAETIGVNGEAFLTEDGSGGVWVAATEPGTPASDAGVLAGDIIVELNGIPMGAPNDAGYATLESYCDVLRTANPGDPISIEVYRLDTDEIWAGELNGAAMEPTFSFQNEFDDAVADDAPDSDSAGTYEVVVDDTGTIGASVPTEWSQRNTGPTDLGLQSGPVPTIVAAPDIAAFNAGYDSAGMAMFAIPGAVDEGLRPRDVMPVLAPDDTTCVLEVEEPYEDPAFVGLLESWRCGADGGSVWIAIAANSIAQPDVIVVVGVVAVTAADLAALDEIVRTFDFV